jgi:acyl carrier protein
MNEFNPSSPAATLPQPDQRTFSEKDRSDLESLLAEYPCVEQVAVVQQERHEGGLELVAYFATEDNCALALPPLEAYLSRAVQAHLVPTHFTQRESLPLAADGSIDRGALLLAREAPAIQAAKPMSEIEERVLAVVRDTIHVQTVTLDDNFFDVGGHSLLGTQFVLRARKVFGVKITLRDVFEAETVADLAARIESLIFEEIEALSEQEASQLNPENVA